MDNLQKLYEKYKEQCMHETMKHIRNQSAKSARKSVYRNSLKYLLLATFQANDYSNLFILPLMDRWKKGKEHRGSSDSQSNRGGEMWKL